MSVAYLDSSVENQEGRKHFLTESNSLNTFSPRVAPLLSPSGTLSPLDLLLSTFTAAFIHIFFHNDEAMVQAELATSVNIAKRCGD